MFTAVKFPNSEIVHLDSDDIGEAGDFTMCGIYDRNDEMIDLGYLGDFEEEIVTCKRCLDIMEKRRIKFVPEKSL
jgi:hypothetical protein